jgi:beta-fructofuranosidase
MLRLPSSWVWDFWTADDGTEHHLFFLKASRALGDPDRRHWRASIGHATSTDLIEWAEQPDALVAGDDGDFDDLATWTGSIVRDDAGMWRMFYTGVDRRGEGLVQRIGSARSEDLTTWRRDHLVIEPDRKYYETIEDHAWPDQAWRDPWVYRLAPDAPWQMLVTARSHGGSTDQRGVVGHATSLDLDRWTVDAALSATDSGFGQLEVLQLVEVDGRWVLLFSCMTPELSRERRERGETGGIWAVTVADPEGPFDVEGAYLLADERLYVGRLVRRRDGNWCLMAFRNLDEDGAFVGEITDPVAVAWREDRLEVLDLVRLGSDG